jgi:hypothetical protein
LLFLLVQVKITTKGALHALLRGLGGDARAMEDLLLKIFGHNTGRLLLHLILQAKSGESGLILGRRLVKVNHQIAIQEHLWRWLLHICALLQMFTFLVRRGRGATPG